MLVTQNFSPHPCKPSITFASSSSKQSYIMNFSEQRPDLISRRTFIKKTSLSAGAIALLSPGTGFAETISSGLYTFDTHKKAVLNTTVTGSGSGSSAPEAELAARNDLVDKLLNTSSQATITTFNSVTRSTPPQPVPAADRRPVPAGTPATLQTVGPAYNGATMRFECTITAHATAVVSWQFQK